MADSSPPSIVLKARISDRIILKLGKSSEVTKLYDDYQKKSAEKELEKNKFLKDIVDFLTNNIKEDQAEKEWINRR